MEDAVYGGMGGKLWIQNTIDEELLVKDVAIVEQKP